MAIYSDLRRVSNPLPRPNVLIVEDETLIAMDLELQLQQLGYAVQGIAASGEEAMELAQELNPDLVLMDIRLEGDMDGIEAAARIRDKLRLPVLFVTSHTDDATVQRAKLTAPFGYIVKPFAERELHSSIQITLHRHQLEKELEEKQQWWKTTLRSLGDGVVATNTDGNVAFMNPVAEKLTGWGEQEAIGRRIDEVMPLTSDNADFVNPIYRALYDLTAVALPWDTSLLSKNGTSILIEDAATPIQDTRGKLLGGVMVFRDVTELQQAVGTLAGCLLAISLHLGRVARCQNKEILAINAELEKRALARTSKLHSAIANSEDTINNLRRREERFSSLVTATNQIIWTNNTEGEMSGDQPAWGAFTGQTIEEYQGYGWSQALHPDDVEHTIAIWKHAVSTSSVCEFEHRVRRADGVYRDFWVRAVPVWEQDGSIREWVGVHNDITERKYLEHQLRESEAFTRSVIDSSPDCITVLDLDARLLSMSPGGLRALRNRKFDSDRGSLWHQFWQGEDREQAEAAIAAAMSGATGTFEGFSPTLDGEPKWWHVVVTAIVDEHAKPIRLLAVSRDITERKAAEEELRRSEERFRITFANAPVGIVQADPANGKFLRVNEEFVRISGYTAQQLTGISFTDITHPADRDETAWLFAELVSGRRASFSMEKRYVRPDGTSVWISGTVSLVRRTDGAPLHILAVIQDITVRKEAEGKLRESEARYRAMLEQSPVAVHVLDRRGETIAVNPAFEHLFAVNAADIIGFNLLNDPQPAANGTRELLERAFAGEVTSTPAIQHDAAVSVGVGRAPWIEVTAYPVKDKVGQVQEVVLLSRNVTDRELAQSALREREAQFRQMADSMPQIVWTATPDGNLDYYNQRWYDYTGMTFEQTKACGWKPVLHPDDLETCVQRWTESVKTGEPYEIEHRFKRASDDVYRWHLGRATPLRDSEGRIVRWFGTCTDVHARKALEEELDTQVRSRTAELEEKIRHLQTAERTIAESLTEKEVLLQEVHHRVKNNLQVISSMLRMQSEYVTDQGTRDQFQESRNRVLSMALIHEHLYQSSSLTQVEFSAYVTQVVHNIVSAHKSSRAISLQIHADKGLLLHTKQTVACGLILTELVSNCLKHGLKTHGGRLEIRVSQAEDVVTIRVQDSGPGLPHDFLISEQKSLGLKLVTSLTRQLRGQLTYGSEGGAWFELQFRAFGQGQRTAA